MLSKELANDFASLLPIHLLLIVDSTLINYESYTLPCEFRADWLLCAKSKDDKSI
jgi:hypothetical protein